MDAQFIASLDQIDAREWNTVTGVDYPFLRHEFLYGLERSGCTTAESGWQPCHLILREGTAARAVLPLYLKSHSYGEYVFDWSWADAWRQAGLHYYPKLVSAIPFTPATGPRLSCSPELAPDAAWEIALAAIREFAEARELSSWHLLFPEPDVSGNLLRAGLPQRSATQFHWFNEGFSDFEHFLSGFTSRKRKSIKRERKRVAEQGLTLITRVGGEIRDVDWERFHHFYQLTYVKRSGHGGYLTGEFFTEVAPSLGEQVLMVQAESKGEVVAAALYFRSADTLYGRYWGCRQEFDCLHFEACYYQGIEFCIRHGLRRFDPGAQGEHKIQRGFRPIETYSNHWIADPRLADAVRDFTRREKHHTEAYMMQAETLLPFRSTEQ